MSLHSDDLLADRRFAWAASLAQEGDFDAAADLLRQTLERAPHWAPAWAALAEAHEAAGATAEAVAAWKRVDQLDTEGTFGAALHLARLRGTSAPSMPDAYVRSLFDAYAPRFDRHLCERLNYRGPALLAEALAAVAPGRRFAEALDLGCGTGLVGQALRPLVAACDGVDLSPAMIEQARRTGAYRCLAVSSLVDALAGSAPCRYELVTAADVLVYLGDLAPAMRGIARVLAPSGLLVFTVQAAESGSYLLGPDLRFSHAEAYVDDVVAGAGLAVVRSTPAATRTERGRDVPGLVVCCVRADQAGRLA